MTTPAITYVGGVFGPGDAGTLPPPGLSTFILDEDESLRDHLKGVVVQDANNASRAVGVWFGQPDPELRDQKYPYITIDLLNVSENRDQVMDRYGPLDRAHDYLVPEDANVAVRAMSPTPMLLTYQVSSWARNPRHDRQIINTLLHGPLHPRFAQLDDKESTSRRLVVLSFAKRDTTEDSRRLFRNIWTVQVVSELFYSPLGLIRRAGTVSINSNAVTPVKPAEFADTPLLYPR